jgi:osmotically-inducible protein OsmY
MRFIRTLLTLAVVAVVAVLAYNYWSGNGLTLNPSPGSAGIDAEAARDKGKAMLKEGAASAEKAAARVEDAVSEGTLTMKIKSKMALDDSVKARTINVDTAGSVVTLTGMVETTAERERAVRLARETDGVTNVVDKLEVRKP